MVINLVEAAGLPSLSHNCWLHTCTLAGKCCMTTLALLSLSIWFEPVLLSMPFSHAICPGGMRVIDYSTHIVVKDKCALLTSVQNSQSVIKSLLNMIRFGKYFILTSSKYQVSECVLTITPRIVLLFCSTDQTTCCYLLRGWRVAPLLLHTPSTFHTSQHLNHLFGHCQEQKEKKIYPVPLWHKRMQTVTCVRGCGWTQQLPLLQSRFVGWFCVHNCSAVPS